MKRIFHFENSQKKIVAEHYEGNLDMNFLFEAPQILIAPHYERDFDMIFHVKAAQNFAAECYGIFLTGFSSLSLLKTWLRCIMKVDFDMIFRLNAAQKLVAEHSVSDFYMIFHLKAAQNSVAEHCEI